MNMKKIFLVTILALLIFNAQLFAQCSITLASGSGAKNQSRCRTEAIATIVFDISNLAISGSVTGLPTGISANVNLNEDKITISGSSNAAGTYNYQVKTTCFIGFGTITTTTTGTITIKAYNTITLTSAAGTNAQTINICGQPVPIANITYSTTGATGATVTGLPNGISGSWANNQVTISGASQSLGTYNYTVTSTGGCPNVTRTGTITGNNGCQGNLCEIILTSPPGTNSQTACINLPIANITYSDGASPANPTVTGLPPGVNWSFANNQVLINGAPQATGTYIYVVKDDNCSIDVAIGTITVTSGQPNTITLTSAAGSNAQTTCINFPIIEIRYTTTGATNATVTGLPTGVTGSWSNNQVLINGTPQDTGTYNYKVTLTGGCGPAVLTTGTIMVPILQVEQPDEQVVCDKDNALDVLFTGSPPNAPFYTYSWTNSNTTIGLGSSGIGNIPGFVATNNDSVPVSATITVTPRFIGNGTTCEGNPKSFTITVNPSPNASIAPPSQTICTGSSITPIVLTSSTTGTNYIWNRYSTLNQVIEATGVGDIISGQLTNPGNMPDTKIYIVLPRAQGCIGEIIIAPVVVNPMPQVDSIANPTQTKCSGSLISPIVFGSHVSGTTYTWRRDNGYLTGGNVRGLDSTGNGNISGILINITNAPVLVTFTITPSANNCQGPSVTATVLVYPQLTVSASPASQTKCSNTPINTIVLSGNSVAGVINNWTRDNTGSVTGIPANGFGNIVGTLTNTTTSSVTVTFTITPTANGCQGTPITAAVLVNPKPTVDTVFNQVHCNGAITTAVFLNGAVPGTLFNWTNSNATIGLAASGIGNIPAFTAVNLTNLVQVATITITPSANGCNGNSRSFTITVNPIPIVDTVPSQVVCNGSPTVAVSFTGAVVGTIYNWTNSNTSIGLGASGTGNIASFPATNAGITPITGTITVRPVFTNGGVSCTGTARTFNITVNPTPTVNQSANDTVCVGTVKTVIFTGAVAGTVYNWTNSNTAIGLAGSGAGIISFAATNTTAAPINANINVTPVFTNGGITCTGTPTSFTITVNPTAAINPVTSQVRCNGASTAAVIFNSPASGGVATFNWTNSNPGIGLAASGTGNIASFTTTNPTNTPIVATIKVKTSFSNGSVSCTGDSTSFTITVNPTPKVDTIANLIFCNRDSIPRINFSSLTPGASFTWTSSRSIGFGTSGGGFISSSVANNTGDTPVIATVRMSITANNCTGPDRTFTITVNPSPPKPNFRSLSQYPDNTVLNLCKGAENINFNVIAPAAGVSYLWSSDLPNVSIKNSNDPNTVISFPDAGTYRIKVVATNNLYSNSCKDSVTQTVIVDASSGIDKRKIFLKQPGNLLIYPDNTMNTVDGYQWGYDLLLKPPPNPVYGAPVPVPAQVYQFFVPSSRAIVNNELDTFKYAFWVLLRKGRCYSRVYYNGPYANFWNGIAPPETNTVELKVFPNPNNGDFNIALNGNIYGDMQAKIYNALRQVVFSKQFTKRIPDIVERLTPVNLASGLYYLEINSSDLKKVTTRFIVQH